MAENRITNAELNRQMNDLADDVKSLTTSVQALSVDTNRLTDAWNTANGVLVIVKWLSIVAGGLGTLWLAIVTYLKAHH